MSSSVRRPGSSTKDANANRFPLKPGTTVAQLEKLYTEGLRGNSPVIHFYGMIEPIVRLLFNEIGELRDKLSSEKKTVDDLRNKV